MQLMVPPKSWHWTPTSFWWSGFKHKPLKSLHRASMTIQDGSIYRYLSLKRVFHRSKTIRAPYCQSFSNFLINTLNKTWDVYGCLLMQILQHPTTTLPQKCYPWLGKLLEDLFIFRQTKSCLLRSTPTTQTQAARDAQTRPGTSSRSVTWISDSCFTMCGTPFFQDKASWKHD